MAREPEAAMRVSELLDALQTYGTYRLLTGAEALIRGIHHRTIQRVGLGLTGYVEHLDDDRVQMFGRSEIGYLWSRATDERAAVLTALLDVGFPALVVTSGGEVPPELRELASETPCALIVTTDESTVATTRINRTLHQRLTPRDSRHGVLVDVFGVGVLLVGKSGIGKSEVGLELVADGHRLVSDDIVLLEQESPHVVLGSSPDLTRHHMEIRGLGILNIRDLFGAASVRDRKRVELVCELEDWNPEREYDRLGLDEQTIELAGVEVPHVVVPVRPGRSLKRILEVAARDRLLKAQGTHSAQAFSARLRTMLARRVRPAEQTLPGLKQTDLE